MTTEKTAGDVGDTPKKGNSPKDVIVGLVVIVVVAVGVWFFFLRSTGPTPTSPAEKAEANAQIAQQKCEDMVKDRLKSPASAKFSGVQTTGTPDTGWTIAGAVDSQNSFGAMLRNDFTCAATYNAPDNMIHVDVTSLTERD